MMAQFQNAQAELSLRKILPILLTITAGMFLVILDSTVMNVAVHKLVQSFNTNVGTVQWVITVYTLAMAAVIPLAGWFSAEGIPDGAGHGSSISGRDCRREIKPLTI